MRKSHSYSGHWYSMWEWDHYVKLSKQLSPPHFFVSRLIAIILQDWNLLNKALLWSCTNVPRTQHLSFYGNQRMQYSYTATVVGTVKMILFKHWPGSWVCVIMFNNFTDVGYYSILGAMLWTASSTNIQDGLSVSAGSWPLDQIGITGSGCD